MNKNSRVESIYDLDALETLDSVQKSLYGLADLLEGQSIDDIPIDTKQNLGEIIRTLGDMQTYARMEIRYKLGKNDR